MWSRSLGLVEKEGESENLGIVVSLVGTLGGTSTGGGTTWILGGCWSRGGWSWIVCDGSSIVPHTAATTGGGESGADLLPRFILAVVCNTLCPIKAGVLTTPIIVPLPISGALHSAVS